MSIIKRLGSLNFALFLIAALVILLSVSTFTESVYGTPFAQNLIYNAGWFDIFLGLVWINIFCATLTRFPFQKKHIGFVITHIGILALLIGAFLSRTLGIEGQMTIFEDESKNRILLHGHSLKVVDEDSKIREINLVPFKNGKPREIKFNIPGLKIYVTRFLEHAGEKESLVEGSAAEASNHAVEATLSGEMMGIHETFVLIEKDPFDRNAYFKEIGPAHFEIKPKSPDAPTLLLPRLLLHSKTSNETFEVELDPNAKEIKIPGSFLKLSHIRYLPNAKVKDSVLVNDPVEVHFNPAVEFEISDKKHSENHTKFMLFPDFESLKGGAPNNFFDLEVKLDAPIPPGWNAPKTPSLTFFTTPNHEWSYQVRSSHDTDPDKVPFHKLERNEKIKTGWMDMQVEVRSLFDHAKVLKQIGEQKESESSAAEILIRRYDGSEERVWLLEKKPVIFGSDQNLFKITLEPKSVTLPFSIKLKDFRKVDYPGTSSPSSFESDVVVTNPSAEKTISMNKPLDHNGYRIFQASYIQDETLGEASVFSIAKNPGIRFIYSGAIIILIGVIILFYFHPFFTGKKH